MAAALTIAVLLALSVTVVRIAAAAMRLTGLAENVARFQCISALTGTGFTSRESEMVVNYPGRRRILAGLTIVGNIDLVSVAATFIVAFTGVDRGADAILARIFAIAAAVGITFVAATSKTLDRLTCHSIGFVLMKTTWLGRLIEQVKVTADETASRTQKPPWRQPSWPKKPTTQQFPVLYGIGAPKGMKMRTGLLQSTSNAATMLPKR